MTSPILDGVTLLEEEVGAGGWRARLRVEPSSRLFEGHFDGEPILPGIAQLALVRHGLRVLGGDGMALAALPSVRFRRPVRPGDLLEVAVAVPGADGLSRFELHVEGEVAAAGVAEGGTVG